MTEDLQALPPRLPRPSPVTGDRLVLPAGNDVHLWRIAIGGGADLEAPGDPLSADERDRAARFKFDLHRNRFSLARANLRMILGGYLDRTAAEIAFQYNDFGKPFLARGDWPCDLRFNLSHAEDLGLVAVACGREVGVDLEGLARDVDVMSLAERFFSDREVAALTAIPPEHRKKGFFTIWTQKEAYVKAKGEGLSMPLDRFDVSPDTGPRGSLTTRPDPSEGSRWTLLQVDPAPGFVAAVAVAGNCDRIEFREFNVPAPDAGSPGNDSHR